MVDRFKAWRKQKADEEGVPAFCVCTNKIMDAILSAMPQSVQALQAVHGMGPSKVAKYSAAILALCKGQTPIASSPGAPPFLVVFVIRLCA